MSYNTPRKYLIALKNSLRFKENSGEEFALADYVQQILENYVIVPKDTILAFLEFETKDLSDNRSARILKFTFKLRKEGESKFIHDVKNLKILDEDMKKEIIAELEIG